MARIVRMVFMAIALAVPAARAAIVSFDFTLGGGDYSSSASRYDYTNGQTTDLPPPGPAVIGGLTLNGHFVVDTAQGHYDDSGADPIWASDSSTFITSTILAGNAAPGLSIPVMGTPKGTFFTYGNYAKFSVVDVFGSETRTAGGDIATATVEFVVNELIIYGGFSLTDFDGFQLPTQFDPGATIQLTSSRHTQTLAYSGPGLFQSSTTTYRSASASGTIADAGGGGVTVAGAESVPEPAALGLFGAGLLGAGLARRRAVRSSPHSASGAPPQGGGAAGGH